MSPSCSLACAGMFLLFGAALPVQAAITSNSLLHNALANNSLTFNSITHNSLSLNSITHNSLSLNSITHNAVTGNALASSAPAVDDLNGVAVEAIALPPGVGR